MEGILMVLKARRVKYEYFSETVLYQPHCGFNVPRIIFQ